MLQLKHEAKTSNRLLGTATEQHTGHYGGGDMAVFGLGGGLAGTGGKGSC